MYPAVVISWVRRTQLITNPTNNDLFLMFSTFFNINCYLKIVLYVHTYIQPPETFFSIPIDFLFYFQKHSFTPETFCLTPRDTLLTPRDILFDPRKRALRYNGIIVFQCFSLISLIFNEF